VIRLSNVLELILSKLLFNNFKLLRLDNAHRSILHTKYRPSNKRSKLSQWKLASFSILFRNPVVTLLPICEMLMPFDPLELAISHWQSQTSYPLTNVRCARTV